MTVDSLLSDAGWLFFAAWSIIVGIVTFAAFGSELFPAKVPPRAPAHPAPPLPLPAKRQRPA